MPIEGAISLSKSQLRRLFRRHYGASAQLARQLTVSRTTISRWLKGEVVSKRIEIAAARMAEDLLSAEPKHRLSLTEFEA